MPPLNSATVIRPIDFLHPHAKISLWNLEPDYDPEYRLISSRSDALNLLDETKRSLSEFWNMYSRTYLTTLQNLHSQFANIKYTRGEPQVGAVVLLMDNTIPRSMWNMGIVTQVHKSDDGNIRSVSVRNAKGRILQRSINMLVPLELQST